MLTREDWLGDLIDAGFAGLLHFPCHNAFTAAGSHVVMEDGPCDPIDLAYATQSGTMRATHPLVFFNACRRAGQIDWFSTALSWAPQFLRAGAGAFVGTLWPVRSDSALLFAERFYDHLVTRGSTLGQASLAARQAIQRHGGDRPGWPTPCTAARRPVRRADRRRPAGGSRARCAGAVPCDRCAANWPPSGVCETEGRLDRSPRAPAPWG